MPPEFFITHLYEILSLQSVRPTVKDNLDDETRPIRLRWLIKSATSLSLTCSTYVSSLLNLVAVNDHCCLSRFCRCTQLLISLLPMNSVAYLPFVDEHSCWSRFGQWTGLLILLPTQLLISLLSVNSVADLVAVGELCCWSRCCQCTLLLISLLSMNIAEGVACQWKPEDTRREAQTEDWLMTDRLTDSRKSFHIYTQHFTPPHFHIHITSCLTRISSWFA